MAAAVGAILLCSVTASAQSVEELKRLSLEQLMNVRVTTLSKTPEPTFELPASVFVLTHDDIRRSGATSLPEALRLVPGLQVARISGGTWAIGSRGFADRLARSMLVLIDGRAVYSPLFAGTYWEVQDVLLEDVDRIEVIRGPGGTLWGANAVNGIINIITRRAGDTRGVYVEAGGGTQEHALGAIQYGGGNDRVRYRVYGKGVDRAPEYHATGPAYDHWSVGQAGFRTDWALEHERALTIQGDAYYGELGERPTLSSYSAPYARTFTRDAPLSGGNMLARLSGRVGGSSDYQLQAYYDRTNRDELPVGEDRDTFDVDFQQSLRRARHQVVAGGGYRLTSGRITAVAPTEFIPATRTDSLFTGFVQDEYAITPVWKATAGVKLEHNAYSGFEFQPAARLTITPDHWQTVTVSATRAVRTPSRVETDYTTINFIPANIAGLPTFVRLEPDPDFVPEKLVAYEAGYRVRPIARMSVAVAAFFNQFNDLLSTDLIGTFVENLPPSPPRVILPVTFTNTLHGSSHGVEITADIRPTSWWRWTTNYSYLQVDVTRDPGSRDVSQEHNYERQSPAHQVQLQSSFDLPRHVQLDWIYRYISELPIAPAPIPAYGTSNVRLGWEATPHVELAVVGQDLQSNRHVEWPGGFGIERSGSARVTVRW